MLPIEILLLHPTLTIRIPPKAEWLPILILQFSPLYNNSRITKNDTIFKNNLVVFPLIVIVVLRIEDLFKIIRLFSPVIENFDFSISPLVSIVLKCPMKEYEYWKNIRDILTLFPLPTKPIKII